MSERQIRGRYNFLKIVFFTIFLADSLYYSYTSLFLSSINFEEGVIGTIASITTIVYLVVNPIWNLFARDSKRIKYMLTAIAVLSGIFIIIYGQMTTVQMIMLFTGLLASVIAPFYALLDGYTINFCNKYEKEYSSIRVMGSISYIFGSAIGGILIDLLGFSKLFILSGAIFILAGIFIAFLRGNSSEIKEEKKRNFKVILKNKWFFAYACCYLFTATLNTVGDNFVSLLFCKIRNLSSTEYGFIAAAIILTEVITMLILARFGKKIRDLHIISFIGISYFLKGLLLSFVNLPLPILIGAACLRGVAWGSLLFIHMKYLVKLVGIENTTAAALIVVTLGSLFQVIGLNLFGYLFENVGYDFSYKLISILSLTVCIAFVISRGIYEKKYSDS